MKNILLASLVLLLMLMFSYVVATEETTLVCPVRPRTDIRGPPGIPGKPGSKGKYSVAIFLIQNEETRWGRGESKKHLFAKWLFLPSKKLIYK